MKKNKKNTIYFLLPLVLIIWGLIFYKIFSGNSKDRTHHQSVVNRIYDNSHDTTTKQNFELDLNYKDPFLKTDEVINSEQKKMNVEIKKPEKLKKTNWPIIRYSGCIKNEKGILAYLDINGEVILAKVPSENNGIKTLNINSDSIYIEYNKEKKWIQK